MRQLTTFPRLAAAAGLLLLGTSAAQAQTAYGLLTTATATPSLVTFQVTAPGTFTATTPITGLPQGQSLVGLDSRPNTGELFALGYNGVSLAQLYTLNVATGALTPVGSALALSLGTNPARIGFDFNPTVDRIRVTGSNNANFRLNPNNGTIAATDGNLAYATTDANAGQTPGVGAVAYTNSYIGATATTLYDVDAANSRLTLQNPPNNGTLNTVGPLSVGTNNPQSGGNDLDIYFNLTTRTNQAYLSVVNGGSVGFSTALYTLDLTTGATTAAGSIGMGVAVTDIALQITRTVPPTVAGNLAYALAGTNLLTFDTAAPGTIRTAVGITGVDASQTLMGLDIRPATNVLYGLGYQASAQMAQLYTLNATTGVATAVGAPVMLALGTSDAIGFDFNPTVDLIRVVGLNRANYRLNPIDGTISVTDMPLAYAAGDPNAGAIPAIATVAYTNSFPGANATSGTTLYDYDRILNVLATQLPPNNGTLNTQVGGSGLTLNATAPSVSLDIYSPAANTNTAYLAANTAASPNTNFYTMTLPTGATTLVGAIGNGLVVRDLAVASATGVVTAVRERADLAMGVSLYPNPAAGSTQVAFTLPRAGRVALSVLDALGRRVETPAPVLLSAGSHTLRWATGTVKPGLYVVRLTVNGQPAAARQVAVE